MRGEVEMVKKLLLSFTLMSFLFLAGVSTAQNNTGTQAYLRLLKLSNDDTTVSLTLANGQTVLNNLATGSVSDYLALDVNRSTFVTLTFTPTRGLAFRKEYPIPPLTAQHYTAVLVGSSTDNSLELTMIAEDDLCADKIASGSCIIFINNINGSPPLTMTVNTNPVISAAQYRETVVGSRAAGSYLASTVVDQNNPQTVVFPLQRGFYEPNVIYLDSLSGRYPGNPGSDYSFGVIRRVPVDTMTFLRGLKANLQLTDDGTTLFATENIVAILDASKYDTFLANTQLAFTVFAPLDGAVLKIAPELYQCAVSQPAAMRALILNHVLVGSFTPAQLIQARQVASLDGVVHTFQATNGGVLIDNTVVVPTDVSYPTSNGMVYLINSVLLPPNFTDQYCTSG